MTDEMKPYPDYKDSGVPWLGKIPAHWDVRRNGRLFAQRNETGFGELPILEVSLRTGVRVRDMDNLKRKQVMSDAEKYKRACKDDIAYNMMRMWQGALGTAPVDGLVSPAYVVARPFAETNPKYYSYLFRTRAYMDEVDGYSRGIVKDRNRLYWQDFKRMPSCFPPTDEQAAIVRFLDANAALVRQFIRNRRRLIEVLTEQKQAIINRAVTRGLDPSVKLKPSGVDWLGDVPEHWEVKRCKYLFREIDQRSKNGKETHLSMSQRFGLVPSDGMDRKHLRSESYAGGKLCETNDLVLNRLKAHLGVFSVAGQSGVISPDYTVLRPHEACDASYYERLFKTPPSIAMLRRSTKGIVEGFWRLYTDDFYNIAVPVPPMNERLAILDWLSSATSELDSAIDLGFREISHIRDYRDRLIANVVCGKLNVATFDLNYLPGAVNGMDLIESDDFTDEPELELDEELAHADD